MGDDEEAAEAQENTGTGDAGDADFPTIEAPEDSELPFAPPGYDPEESSDSEEE
jgi:hypothetical protein